MVETEINETRPQSGDEFSQIMCHIRSGQNFLLSGGAGSGKTFTLVQVIKQIIEEYPTATIACMTYTNAAVKEIEERVNDKHLNVTTIHDFLWDNIKNFQKELKSSLISLINDQKIKITEEIPITEEYFDNPEREIRYREYLKIKMGIISHDEVLLLANHIFGTHQKLSNIIKDKFSFIFIDEYQDTQEKVVEIFLDYLNQSEKQNTIGFFGDSMQSIYDDGIGDIDCYKGDEEGKVKEVQKTQNRRNPQLIIDLANELRTDGLTQNPSDDLQAPNINKDGSIKTGNIKFIYSAEENLTKVRNYLAWDFNLVEDTKELNLTHNLIADKAGIRNLVDIYDRDLILKYRDRIKKYIKDNTIADNFDENTFGEVIDLLKQGRTIRSLSPTPGMQTFINDNDTLFQKALSSPYSLFSKLYVNKDQLLDDKKQNSDEENKKGSKRDDLIKHLYKIQHNIFLYTDGQYNEFIRKTEYSIHSVQDKIDLKTAIEELTNVEEKTIEEIIIEADEKGICRIDDELEIFKTEKEYLYDRVKNVRFQEFQELYKYLEGFTPFSTQHKTKGTEFNNVLVILDNGNWRNYDFEGLFLNSGTESVLKRTQKIFYVCCTRAKGNLAVYYCQPSASVIQKATEWFGEGNAINLDEIA